MIREEDLNLLGIKVYQDDSLYCFTSDAILLSRFTLVKKGDVVADFCSGSGIIGFNLYGLNPIIKSVTFFEMQKPLFDLSVMSIKANALDSVFSAVNTRVQDIGKDYNEKFSLIVCNPPYCASGTGEVNKDNEKAKCRSDGELPLSDLIFAVSKALKFGGRFCIVQRSDRLAEIIFELKKKGLEPKRMQFVSGGNKAPYLFMLEAVKGGKSGIKVLDTIRN